MQDNQLEAKHMHNNIMQQIYTKHTTMNFEVLTYGQVWDHVLPYNNTFVYHFHSKHVIRIQYMIHQRKINLYPKKL
jgi:hypothetical protein